MWVSCSEHMEIDHVQLVAQSWPLFWHGIYHQLYWKIPEQVQCTKPQAPPINNLGPFQLYLWVSCCKSMSIDHVELVTKSWPFLSHWLFLYHRQMRPPFCLTNYFYCFYGIDKWDPLFVSLIDSEPSITVNQSVSFPPLDSLFGILPMKQCLCIPRDWLQSTVQSSLSLLFVIIVPPVGGSAARERSELVRLCAFVWQKGSLLEKEASVVERTASWLCPPCSLATVAHHPPSWRGESVVDRDIQQALERAGDEDVGADLSEEGRKEKKT